MEPQEIDWTAVHEFNHLGDIPFCPVDEPEIEEYIDMGGEA